MFNYSSIICWKDYFFSIELFLYLFQKSIRHICVGLFLYSLFCFIDWCVCSFTNATQSWLSSNRNLILYLLLTYYYINNLILNIKKYTIIEWVLKLDNLRNIFFQHCFKYSSSFASPYEVWNNFICFYKETLAGILIEDYIKPAYQFGKNWHLNYVETCNLWTCFFQSLQFLSSGFV